MNRRVWIVLLLMGLAGVSFADYPVGAIYTNDYTDAYGRYQWIYLQTESGSVQHGVQTQWRLDGSLYWTVTLSYGIRNGNETYYYDNSSPSSEVSYSNGAVSGWVRYYDTSGNKTYESLFVDNVPNGPVRAWCSASQLSMEGSYSEGQYDGLWRQWYCSPYQPQSEISYSHGVLDGDYKTWYENGQLHVSARYSGNMPEGEYIENNEQGYPTLTKTYQGGSETRRSEMYYDFTGTLMRFRYDYEDSVLVMNRSWYGTGSEEYVLRYKGGSLHGLCSAWYPNHVLKEESEYVEGALLHLFRANENGRKNEEQFWHLTGELESWTRWLYHWPDYTVMAREYNSDVDDLSDGLTTYWYTNGVMMTRTTYKHGMRDGLSEEWYDNGVKRFSGHYRNNVLHGLAQEWQTNGVPLDEYTFRNGLLHGPARTWYPNGKLAQELNYVNRLLHGPATEYSQWDWEHYVKHSV